MIIDSMLSLVAVVGLMAPPVASPAPVAPAPASTAPAAAPVAAPAAAPAVVAPAAPSAAPATAAAPVAAPSADPAAAPAPTAAPSSAPAASSPATAPATRTAPVPVAPRQPAVTAPRIDPEIERQDRVGTGLIAGGSSVLIAGGAALLFVALPSRARYINELEAAEDARWVTDREKPAADARRLRTVMVTSALVGASLAVVGTGLLTMGVSRRNRARRSAAATLSLAPAVGGGHYGAGATVRF